MADTMRQGGGIPRGINPLQPGINTQTGEIDREAQAQARRDIEAAIAETQAARAEAVALARQEAADLENRRALEVSTKAFALRKKVIKEAADAQQKREAAQVVRDGAGGEEGGEGGVAASEAPRQRAKRKATP